MDKTIKLYEQILKNGPYSEVAPQAQINIGTAHEQKMVPDHPEAARAYERAADRYHDQKNVAADAQFKAGMAYYKQAKSAGYDAETSSESATSRSRPPET